MDRKTACRLDRIVPVIDYALMTGLLLANAVLGIALNEIAPSVTGVLLSFIGILGLVRWINRRDDPRVKRQQVNPDDAAESS
jgi:hypothetical protein